MASRWVLCLYVCEIAFSLCAAWGKVYKAINEEDYSWLDNFGLAPVVGTGNNVIIVREQDSESSDCFRAFVCCPFFFGHAFIETVWSILILLVMHLVLPILAQLVIWSTMLVGLVFFACTGFIWLMCYCLTLPLWHQSDTVSSTLALVSAGHPCVVHAATIPHKRCQILNRTRSTPPSLYETCSQNDSTMQVRLRC